MVAMTIFGALCACPQTPAELLSQADRLADSSNLFKAQRLYREAEAGFRSAGDQSNELRARLGTVRYKVQRGYYTASREELQHLVQTSLVENDLQLKIRCLEILGNIDMNQNTPAALNDWTNLLLAAETAKDAKWVNRANGYLGIVSGIYGDLGGAGKALFQALSKAEELKDSPGEITFGIWLANGMSSNGMGDGALHILDRVETFAKQNGYSEMPIQFSIAKVFEFVCSSPENHGYVLNEFGP